VPEPALMPRDADGRYEVRRLCAWFDDKFHNEVTSKLLYERVNKKVTGQGYPDSKNVKSGASRIKYHLDYMAWLLDQRRWLAGDEMTLADFTAAAHLSCWIISAMWTGTGMRCKDWYAKIKSRPSFRSMLADQIRAFRHRRIMPTWISETGDEPACAFVMGPASGLLPDSNGASLDRTIPHPVPGPQEHSDRR
jgi:glutathione S-transferase